MGHRQGKQTRETNALFTYLFNAIFVPGTCFTTIINTIEYAEDDLHL